MTAPTLDVQLHAAPLADGRRHVLGGEPLTSCPYRVGAGDRFDHILGVLWRRAYDRVASLPVDYGDTEDRGQ